MNTNTAVHETTAHKKVFTISAEIAPGVHTEKATITPVKAKEILETQNPKNRPITPGHVETLAREMEGGRWKFNAEPIRFADGRLLDGQHRLAACVLSNTPFETLVVSGLNDDVFDTIDAGKMRTAADVLALQGEGDATRLAAALRFVQNYLSGTISAKAKYTNTEVEGILRAHPDVRDSVQFCKADGVKLLVPFAVLAGCHYLFAQKDKQAADRMIDQIIRGNGIAVDSPVHVFRERMLQQSLRKTRVPIPYVAAILVKAWNHSRENKTNKVLSFRMGGKNPEAFPVVI
jgi:hypothetical protein